MPSITVPGAIVAGSAISGGAGLLGGLLSSSGAKSAAAQQAQADKYAADLAQQRYQTTRSDLSPYTTAGQQNLGTAANYYKDTQGVVDAAYNQAQAHIPTIPDQATLLNMPGYQFNLDQGLKAVQSQATAGGKGLSGAATKAAENYGTGLANNYLTNYFNMGQSVYGDYSTQLANAVSKQNTVFQQLYAPTTLGENAAAQTGNVGANLANTATNALMTGGQATAAGTAAASGAWSGAVQNLGNNVGNSLMTYAMMGNPGAGANANSLAYNAAMSPANVPGAYGPAFGNGQAVGV